MSPEVSEQDPKLDERCVNAIRALSMDAIQKAASGHPGAPMGLAPAGYALWAQALKHNPENPQWPDRDRFVLSCGHASMLLYSLLYLTGYDVSLDDLKRFRQWRSKTPGHPEFGHTPGVETTTGPLGQGFANAVGMAMAERRLGAMFNRPDCEVVDHHTFVFCGDGDMMEGISAEAASLAGRQGLEKLICVYDDNRISIEGETRITFTEDVGARFAAMEWHVIKVKDGNRADAVLSAIKEAKAETHRPSIILLRTHIAFGSPNKQDSADAHGAPLGEEEVRLTKKSLGLSPDDFFHAPDDVLAHCRRRGEAGKRAEEKWRERHERFKAADPEAAAMWERALQGNWRGLFEKGLFEEASHDPVATRAASGKALNAAARKMPELMGGSADLAPSNKTLIEDSHDFQKETPDGRNIRFGVREHAMGAIMNGMALHGGLRLYGGTFLVFSDYMRPAIRLAALMKLPAIYVFTHDSVAVGEDGPTHQPVEHLAALRAIPGLSVIRPADALETGEAWKIALESDGPVALILSRQKLPVLTDGKQAPGEIDKGARIVWEADETPEIILIGTGSEAHVCLEAGKRLAEKGVSARVVSMASWELFEKAPEDHRNAVLDPAVKARLAVEAGISMGWEKYIGSGGAMIAMNGFGASAPGGALLKRFGFTPEAAVQKALDILGK